MADIAEFTGYISRDGRFVTEEEWAAEQEQIAKQESMGCPHTACQPDFDEEGSRDCSAAEVRKRWPRFHGTCPRCGERLILYASALHYIRGDW